MTTFGLQLIEEPLHGVLLLEPRIHGDARGYFMETYRDEGSISWVQDNESMSHRGVLRGMHFQRPRMPKPNSYRLFKDRSTMSRLTCAPRRPPTGSILAPS